MDVSYAFKSSTGVLQTSNRSRHCPNASARQVKQIGRSLALRVNALAQRAEYIWHDGLEGAPEKGLLFNEIRSKTKVYQKPITTLNPADFSDWSFDGSSTGQAEGRFSDCVLQPVNVFSDPVRGGDDVLVLCEVYNPDGSPHETNTRAQLRAVLNDKVLAEEPLYGFEQEYTMLEADGRPYGWPVGGGFPAPQGPFYCGVGSSSVYGRDLAEEHLLLCMKAGIQVSGMNAEVMPAQWEFQVGPVGPLDVGDQVHVARYLLHRLGEIKGIVSTFNPKPMKGDWNGTGAHTNFSTKSMREDGGLKVIEEAIEKLAKTHPEHISQYGLGNEARLTGLHETCDLNTFKFGVGDRGSSIRIPFPVSKAGKGYLEDRRPSANVDPYTVARLLIKTCLLS